MFGGLVLAFHCLSSQLKVLSPKLQECRDSNQGWLGVKHNRYLCAMPTPSPLKKLNCHLRLFFHFKVPSWRSSNVWFRRLNILVICIHDNGTFSIKREQARMWQQSSFKLRRNPTLSSCCCCSAQDLTILIEKIKSRGQCYKNLLCQGLIRSTCS